MAKFKTHMSLGVFLGVAMIVLGLIYSFFSGIEAATLLFSGALIGSFLPDIDLDDGVPFQILFGLFGAAIGGLVFFDLYQQGERDYRSLIILSLLSFLVIRFGIGYFFKKFTHHRGIFHSIPAAILFGLLSIWLAHLLSIFHTQELLFGVSITIGYLGHLILDEVYSSVNLGGHSLFPKQSLGSALKLTSSSRIATLLFYLLLFFLASTLPETRGFFI
jgi:hypothetical protein